MCQVPCKVLLYTTSHIIFPTVPEVSAGSTNTLLLRKWSPKEAKDLLKVSKLVDGRGGI